VYEPDADWDNQPISSEQSEELTFVEMDEFLAAFWFSLLGKSARGSYVCAAMQRAPT